MTPEQLEQEAIARNTRRRTTYNLRRNSRQQAGSSTYNLRRNARQQTGSSTLSDITNQDITTGNYTTSNRASSCTRELSNTMFIAFLTLFLRITLPTLPVPEDLRSLYNDQTPIGLHFKRDIRKINHLFALTSMGVHLVESLANAQHGVYTFRAQGSIYHKKGGLLPSTSESQPRFLQLYIYDTEHEVENRLAENSTLRQDIVERVKAILDQCNPFVHNLRSLAQQENVQDCALRINEQPSDRPQYCLPTASQVAAMIVGGEEVANLNPRDILVQSTSGQLMTVLDTAGYYDPLQYPLLFPYGSYGWSINSLDNNGRTIPCRAFYAYIIQVRQCVISIILMAGRLFQQFIVDMFVKIEANKLRWIQDNQNTIRAELYQGLQDCLDVGELNPGNGDQISIDNLIHQIFPNLTEHVGDVSYMVQRAIITPTNDEVDMLNEKILKEFAGEEKNFYSFDSVPEDRQNLYPQEFLNSLSFGGLPPHILKLKFGSPIMLLRNIDTSSGLCNGTRLICSWLRDHVIEAEILTGSHKGTQVFIPCMTLKTAEDVKLPFEMIRKQFPVKLCFALTINKSQGQPFLMLVYISPNMFSAMDNYMLHYREGPHKKQKEF
uniref:ATP-dependent DNA helicase n=1 Tax=Chenopodium quinoa TaxID=63459 RepID=A0A803N7J8_CHEQI